MPKITPHDRDEIAKGIYLGFSSGVLERDGARLTWVLTTDIFTI